MKTALFIDDDENYIYIIKRLHKRGKIPNLFEIMTANNGKEAIDFLLKNLDGKLPNSLFVDINMPVMDGHQFLKKFSEIKKQHERLNEINPIAVVSTSTSVKDMERVAHTGYVEHYLVKDIDMEDLVSKINELLK